VLAGVAAPFVAVAPAISSAAQVENMNRYAIANEVPAIPEEFSYPLETPEQIAEQMVAQHGFRIVSDAMGELAKTVQEVGEAFVDGQKLKENAQEVGEIINALRGMEQGENRDV
jgi:hypothetical protein